MSLLEKIYKKLLNVCSEYTGAVLKAKIRWIKTVQ